MIRAQSSRNSCSTPDDSSGPSPYRSPRPHTGPIPQLVAPMPIEATTASTTVPSRMVPRKASQPNIGITAKTSGGATSLEKIAAVVPTTRIHCTSRSRPVASGRKGATGRKSGRHTMSDAACVPKTARAVRAARSACPESRATVAARPAARVAATVTAPISRETSPSSSSVARRPSGATRWRTSTASMSVAAVEKAIHSSGIAPPASCSRAGTSTAASSTPVRHRCGVVRKSPAASPEAGHRGGTRLASRWAVSANTVPTATASSRSPTRSARSRARVGPTCGIASPSFVPGHGQSRRNGASGTGLCQGWSACSVGVGPGRAAPPLAGRGARAHPLRRVEEGAPSGTRTPNPLIKSQLLCLLS